MGQPEKILTIADSITVGELAEALNLPVTQLVGELFKNGIVATINQRIDFETAQIIVEELKIAVQLKRKEVNSAPVQHLHKPSAKASLRPPIVAVMGHVDHGKTTLLDTILGMKTVASEAGGITQHISAYQTKRGDRVITLLDTPGHEAFAALRQHGAVLTDVVVIVVAADDGVMPQTVEAIKFARNANAKIVVAINKIDKEGANIDRVKAQLASEYQLNPEEWGGDTIMVPISAKTGQNIDKLLDMVLLVADMEELKADTDVPAEGLVIEAHMEKGRGSVVNLLVEQGQLKPSHFLVAGTSYGKVRTLANFRGEALKLAGPSTPVTVTGFKELPQFGSPSA
jgi:translation initiation factor IF-2